MLLYYLVLRGEFIYNHLGFPIIENQFPFDVGFEVLFNLSNLKSKYMEFKFNKNRNVDNAMVRLEDQIILRKYQFWYVRLIVQNEGKIIENATQS